MKICLMTSVYALAENDRNGSFLVETARHLKAKGVDLHVFAPSYEGLKSHTIEGVPVHRFRYFFKRWENLTHMQGAPNRIRNPIYLIIAFFYILLGTFHAIRYCRREKFDLLHVHWPFPHGIWGYAAGKASGTPMVLNFHGAELLLAKKFFFVKYFLRHALHHAKGAICNSSFTAKEVQKLTKKEVDIIPFGCTVNFRPSQKDETKPVKDILFAGRMIERKGVPYLIDAISDINKEIPVHLHLVGDGDQSDAWKTHTEDRGLNQFVTFHGIVSNEELENQYANADIFVLPAIVDDRGDTEGLGVVLVEALSFATPVVASNVGGIPDVIKHNETGILVEERNPTALKDAVVSVLKDRDAASRLVEQGLAHAQDYFDWDRISNSIIDVYTKASA